MIISKGKRLYTPDWSEHVFVIKKVKNTVPQASEVEDLNEEEIVWMFYEKYFKKQIKFSLELKKY